MNFGLKSFPQAPSLMDSVNGKSGSVAPGTITASQQNPISGVFGSGRVAIISSTQNFIVPATTLRVRLWGAGAGSAGGGGGFSMKVLTGLTVGASVLATIGTRGLGSSAYNGGTTSFGAYFSATGGTRNAVDAGFGVGGTGVGGDINTVGGSSGMWSSSNGSCGGGGAANLLGNGGNGGTYYQSGESGSSGGGAGGSSTSTGLWGGIGLAPTGELSLDFIGCGSGTNSPSVNAVSMTPNAPNSGNGGGGASGASGGFPGGGGGVNAPGANGFMTVEW